MREKIKTDFKPTVHCLKIDPVSHPARGVEIEFYTTLQK